MHYDFHSAFLHYITWPFLAEDLEDEVRLMVKDGQGSNDSWSEMNYLNLTESRNKDLVTCDIDRKMIARYTNW